MSMETPDKGFFDRFAGTFSKLTGKAAAFAGAITVILIWALSGPLMGFSDTWQLIINTTTTLITFLMVFLIQNTQNRADTALQKKLDAQSKALRDVMVHLQNPDADTDFEDDIRALETAVGLEAEVGTKKEQS